MLRMTKELSSLDIFHAILSHFTLSEFPFYSSKFLSLREEEEEILDHFRNSSACFVLSRQVHKLQQVLIFRG